MVDILRLFKIDSCWSDDPEPTAYKRDIIGFTGSMGDKLGISVEKGVYSNVNRDYESS